MKDTPTAAWVPDRETIERSRIVAAMRTVGVASFGEFHAWSTANVDAFWRMVIDDLGVVFEHPPSAIRGSDDPRNPDWLPDAELNIAASCLMGEDDAVAVVSAGAAATSVVTIGDLRARVAAFAGGLERAGHEPGDRVAVAMPMTLESVVAYLGIITSGGVVVSIADSFAPDEIAARVRITEPVRIVTQDRSMRLGRELPMYIKCRTASSIPCVVVDTGGGLELREGDAWWTDFIVEGAAFEPVAAPAGSHTNILFSSGTTGDPKAIPWTHTTPLKAAMDGRYHHDIHEGDVVAWPTNLGWMMGPWLIYAALLNRAALALFDDAPTSRAFIEFVEMAGVTMVGVVPSIVATWRGEGLLSRGDWTSVRVVSSTGEASNPDDARWLMDAAGDVPLIEYCGGTEIGGGYITGTVLDPARPAHFTTPALGIDVVILDDDGHTADRGEVFLRPPSIGMSTELLNRNHDEVYYVGVPSGHGSLRRHGDQIVRESDGTYRALGRVDDTMNLGGIKVASVDLETAVAEVAGVIDVAAVGVAPAAGGPDRLVMFVVLVDEVRDLESLKTELQAAIRSRLNPLFRVDEVVAIDSLPRTASHKVMRRVLRDTVMTSG